MLSSIGPMTLSQYFDPGALALVGLGCLLIAWIQNGHAGFLEGVRGAARLVGGRREGENARLAALVVEDIVARRGVNCADRGPSSCAFTHSLGIIMSDQPDYESYARAVRALLDREAADRAAGTRTWNDIADAAPALGMLGTVLGLVQMFAAMDGVDGIGAGMAMCLLTSLYGLIFAHIVAGPMARRLELAAAREAAWREAVADRLLALARREYPDRAPPHVARTGGPSAHPALKAVA